jgi:nucleotide-binding universal stress UspA family protein
LVDITTRLRKELTGPAIADEARKGYDLLLIGVEPAAAADGEIDEKVAAIAAAFEGPFAIAIARGAHRREPVAADLDILVPVTGTRHSRRAAEIALALARASLGSVTVLHVARRGQPSWRRRLPRGFSASWESTGTNEEAILRDAVRLGEQFSVPVRTAVRAHADAEEAILRQLNAGEHNLIVMGVSPRPGATLFFGDAAATVLVRSNRSILFVAS